MGKLENDDSGEVPPPILLTAVVCDAAIIDALTGKTSIIGIFGNINSVRYPVRFSRITFFCQLTNGRGKMAISVRVVDVDSDEKILFDHLIAPG